MTDNPNRRRLPNKRACETLEFRHGNFTFVASIGRFGNNEIAEIFIGGPKVGTDVAFAARDSSIVASLALQYGTPIRALQHAISRNSDGTAAGPLGALLDLLSAKGEI
jgi:hypothetical protein